MSTTTETLELWLDDGRFADVVHDGQDVRIYLRSGTRGIDQTLAYFAKVEHVLGQLAGVYGDTAQWRQARCRQRGARGVARDLMRDVRMGRMRAFRVWGPTSHMRTDLSGPLT